MVSVVQRHGMYSKRQDALVTFDSSSVWDCCSSKWVSCYRFRSGQAAKTHIATDSYEARGQDTEGSRRKDSSLVLLAPPFDFVLSVGRNGRVLSLPKACTRTSDSVARVHSRSSHASYSLYPHLPAFYHCSYIHDGLFGS